MLPISHCWMGKVLHGLHLHGDLFLMSRTVPSSLGAEAQEMSVALGFVEWATLFLQELIHGSFYLRGAPAVMQERSPVCVTDCKSLDDHLLAVGSPTTLQDKRSAFDVLIIRVFEKDGLCDTLGTCWFAIGRWTHERQRRGNRMPPTKFEIWVVCAPQ